MFDRGRIFAAAAMAVSTAFLLVESRDFIWSIAPAVVYVLGRSFVKPRIEALWLLITITLIAVADTNNPHTLLGVLLFTCLYG